MKAVKKLPFERLDDTVVRFDGGTVIISPLEVGDDEFEIVLVYGKGEKRVQNYYRHLSKLKEKIRKHLTS